MAKTLKKPNELTHIDAKGRAVMVDISEKTVTARRAIAAAEVAMLPDVLRKIADGKLPKGDAVAVARVAAIQAAKRTSDLIPLCHPIGITSVCVDFEPDESAGIMRIRAEVRAGDRTGAEMEALTAASVAALTIYDMCKALQRDIEIRSVRLIRKEGGKSGTWVRSKKQ
jgi:cyclic pyranopterin monophosphate synthase